MKVLFYISTIRGGGAARVMVNIANGIAEKGYDVVFVTNFPDSHEYELSGKIKRFSIEQTENKGNVLAKNISRIKALKKILKEENPDVSVAFMRENNFRLLYAAKGLPTKTVVSVRNDPAKEYSSKFSKRLANSLYKRADGIVFQTEDAKLAFPVEIQNKSRVILNQVDERFFNENTAPGKYLTACGRLSNQKNYPMMLKAFAEVLKEYPDEILRIYGEGNLKDDLAELAGELGVKESVSFMGFSTQMKEAYSEAKVLLMTSNYEGLPNVLLEAMASSVPVLSTDCPCGGPKMIIKDGENGYLAKVGDEKDFAEKLKLVLSDENRLAEMREGAFRSAQAYRPERILEDWTGMLEMVSADSN